MFCFLFFFFNLFVESLTFPDSGVSRMGSKYLYVLQDTYLSRLKFLGVDGHLPLRDPFQGVLRTGFCSLFWHHFLWPSKQAMQDRLLDMIFIPVWNP